MLAELTRVDSLLPAAASLGAAIAGRGLLAGRRRSALNEALHELRRPLQALVLSASYVGSGRVDGGDLPRQTVLALQRLDREINGGPVVAIPSPISVAGSLNAAVSRWRQRAEAAGACLHLETPLGDAIATVDQAGFARALDNLIINAIEHGGALVLVAAEIEDEALRITVADSGRRDGSSSRHRGAGDLFAALSGRRRHGHGLRVVRTVAAAHGGEFHLRRLGVGVEARLELPLLGAGGAA
jgi:signal transduction histidine kinase